MPTSIGPVVPATAERPKRIAKAFAEIYPKHKLAACQAVTAQLFGFPDWHALEQAIKSGGNPGPFDEDLSLQDLNARRDAQMALIARHLGGVEMDRDYPPPENRDDPFDITPGHNRVKMANLRMEQLQAVDVFYELEPTARSHPPSLDPIDVACLCKMEEFALLPQKISRWWEKNVPHQPEVGKALGRDTWNLKRATGILVFASYWGALSMYYARTIGVPMALGTSFLLAEGYSAVLLPHSGRIQELATAQDRAKRDVADEILQEKLEIEQRFYACYPRDDFLEIWLAQPDAFRKNAESALRTLNRRA